MTTPSRYCPRCRARNAWAEERCAACGADLVSRDSYDERLIWALDHPDTSTSMFAASLLAERDTRDAIDHLAELTESPDPYRAAAAARALAAFDDERAGAIVARLRDHPSVLVRRAVREAAPIPALDGGDA